MNFQLKERVLKDSINGKGDKNNDGPFFQLIFPYLL